jgi:hypothetical protein
LSVGYGKINAVVIGCCLSGRVTTAVVSSACGC